MSDQFDNRALPPAGKPEGFQSLSIPRLEMGIEEEIVAQLQGKILVVPYEGSYDSEPEEPVSLYQIEVSCHRVDIMNSCYVES